MALHRPDKDFINIFTETVDDYNTAGQLISKCSVFIVTLTNLMLPYLEYCVEVWGNTYETLLQLSRKL